MLLPAIQGHPRRRAAFLPLSIGPKVGVYLGPTLLGLLSDLAVLEDEGFPRFILGFQEAFLGSLQHEAQPMEVVQATASTQPQVKALLRNCLTTFQFQLDNSTPASPGGFCTADFSWFC